MPTSDKRLLTGRSRAVSCPECSGVSRVSRDPFIGWQDRGCFADFVAGVYF